MENVLYFDDDIDVLNMFFYFSGMMPNGAVENFELLKRKDNDIENRIYNKLSDADRYPTKCN